MDSKRMDTFLQAIETVFGMKFANSEQFAKSYHDSHVTHLRVYVILTDGKTCKVINNISDFDRRDDIGGFGIVYEQFGTTRTLINFGVLPDFQRRGFGTRLLRFVISQEDESLHWEARGDQPNEFFNAFRPKIDHEEFENGVVSWYFR